MTDSEGFPGEFQAGDIVGDSYAVVDYIGRGAMGHVYHVRHTMLHADYALKTLSRDKVTELAWRRFQNEAHAIAKLNHPNLVSLYNLGLHERLLPFYVMDLLRGKDLGDTLKATGPLDLNVAAKLFVEVCAGISYAHKKGIIHRDIKPGNIFLLTQPGATGETVKVVDFGIAKLSETKDPINQCLTGMGDVVGTPLYMSPEQCMGERVDARSDIYSLGCTLFEAVTGSLPFRARNPTETMMMHQSAPPPTLSKVCPDRQFPSMLEDIVAIALAKHPSDRYQSMEQMAGALTAFIEIDKPLINMPANSIPTPIRQGVNFSLSGPITLEKTKKLAATRLPQIMALTAAALVCVGGGITWYQKQKEDSKKTLSLADQLKLLAGKSATDNTESAKAVEVMEERVTMPRDKPFSTIKKINGKMYRCFTFPSNIEIGQLCTGQPPVYSPARGTRLFPQWEPITFIPSLIVTDDPDCLRRFQAGDIYAVRLGPQGDSDRVFAATLKIPGVTKLDFSGSRHLTMESLNTLRKFNHQLKVFVGSDGTDGETLAQVNGWDLEQLYFGRTKRISSFLRKIAPGAHLIRLGMGTALPSLNGIDCENIAALPNLVYLDLGNNKLNNSYLKILSRLPKLQELRIENCGINVDNIDALKHFKALKVLRIDTRKWPAQDLQKLKNALPGVSISG